MTEKEKQELVLTRMMENDTLHALKTYGISREETEIDLETLFVHKNERDIGKEISHNESTIQNYGRWLELYCNDSSENRTIFRWNVKKQRMGKAF